MDFREKIQIVTVTVAAVGIIISNIVALGVEGRRIEREDRFRWNQRKLEAYTDFLGSLETWEFYARLLRRTGTPSMSESEFIKAYQGVDQATNVIAAVASREVVEKTNALQGDFLGWLQESTKSDKSKMPQGHLQSSSEVLAAKRDWVNMIRKDLGLPKLDDALLYKLVGGDREENSEGQ